MKKNLLIVLSAVLVLAVADGLVMWAFYLREKIEAKKEEEKKKEEDKKESRVEVDEEGKHVVNLDDPTTIAMGIKWKKPRAYKHAAEVVAYGKLVDDPTQIFTLRSPMAGVLVLARDARGKELPWPSIGKLTSPDSAADSITVGALRPRYTPTDLVDLRNKLANAQGDVDAANASLVASRTAYERNKSLIKGDVQLVSVQTLAELESKVASDEARLRTAQKSVQLYEAAVKATGNTADLLALTIAKEGEIEEVLVQPGEAVESGQPILKVRRFDRALARVELPLGETVPRETRTARIRVVGSDGKILNGERVMQAPIDPRTRAQALLFAIAGNEELRPGMAVTAYLPTQGEPQEGVLVPRSSVVRYGGAAWVYVYESEIEKPEPPKPGEAPKPPPKQPKVVNGFTRTEVTLAQALDDGWFVTSGITKSNRIVYEGTHLLLSEELKAVIPAGD